jgi:hypothetical protein
MTSLTSVLQVTRKVVTSKEATSKEATSSQATNKAASAVAINVSPSLNRKLASRFSVVARD